MLFQIILLYLHCKKLIINQIIGDTTMTTKELTQKQKSIRYAISVDFDCMRDGDYSKEDALAWFSSEECLEAYDGEIVDSIYTPTNENFLDIVKEVYLHCGYDKNW